MKEFADRSLAIADVPERGIAATWSTDAAGRDWQARELQLRALSRFEVAFTVKPVPRGRFVLSGTIEATLVQSCVVTLEPIEASLAERFEVEFWPAEQIEAAEAKEIDPDDRDIEPIEEDRLPLGRTIMETFAMAIDPYPRKAGINFNWQDPAASAGEPNPFAVLARLPGRADPKPKA